MSKNWVTIPFDPKKNVECRWCSAIVHGDIEKKLDFHTSLSQHIEQVKKVVADDKS